MIIFKNSRITNDSIESNTRLLVVLRRNMKWDRGNEKGEWYKEMGKFKWESVEVMIMEAKEPMWSKLAYFCGYCLYNRVLQNQKFENNDKNSNDNINNKTLNINIIANQNGPLFPLFSISLTQTNKQSNIHIYLQVTTIPPFFSPLSLER